MKQGQYLIVLKKSSLPEKTYSPVIHVYFLSEVKQLILLTSIRNETVKTIALT